MWIPLTNDADNVAQLSSWIAVDQSFARDPSIVVNQPSAIATLTFSDRKLHGLGFVWSSSQQGTLCHPNNQEQRF